MAEGGAAGKHLLFPKAQQRQAVTGCSLTTLQNNSGDERTMAELTQKRWMETIVEPGPGMGAGLRDFSRKLNINSVSAGIIATIFGCTGPALLVMKAAADGGLSSAQAISWLFGIYVFGGLLGIFLSLRYKLPISGAFSIPAAVMLIGSLQTYSFEQACGAYIFAGLLVLLLGMSGLIGMAMRLLPLPIVQAMIAGCMMRFGLDIVLQTKASPMICGVALAGYFLAHSISRKLPAVLIALIFGIVTAGLSGAFAFDLSKVVWHAPQIFMPSFDINAILSIGIPLAVLVVGAENAQAIGVLYGQGYKPPVNFMTVMSGVGGIVSGLVGAHNANIAGPMTAICSSEEAGEDKSARYTASVINGILFASFGLVGPAAIVLVACMPRPLVGLVAGLAMINVLIGSLKDGFATGNFRMGAFAAIIIGMSNLTLFKIGAPLWALVGGVAVSLLLERKDFQKTS